MRRLLQLPQVFAQAGHGGGWVEDDLRAVKAEATRSFGKVAVITDIDADLCKAQIKDWIAQVARPEVKLLPKARRHVRDVRLAILAEVRAIVVDDRGGVVEEAFLLDFVDRNYHRDFQFTGERLNQADCGAIGNALCRFIPFDRLLGAKIGAVEDLLQTHDLCAICSRLADETQVFLDHGLLLSCQRLGGQHGVGGLDDRTSNDSGHSAPTPRGNSCEY